MLMGVGGGFILVPAMLYILGMSASVVVGTSLFQILFVTMATTMMHALTTKAVDIVLAGLLLLGSVTGAQIGARIAQKAKPEIPAPDRWRRSCWWSRCGWPSGSACGPTRSNGGAAVSALVAARAGRVLRAHRRSATRSWCPRCRSTRSRSARASPAPSCCCSARSSIPTGAARGRDLRHRRRAQGADRADPAAREGEGRRHLGQRRQHRVPLGAVVLRRRQLAADRRDRRRADRGDLRTRARLPAALADRARSTRPSRRASPRAGRPAAARGALPRGRPRA